MPALPFGSSAMIRSVLLAVAAVASFTGAAHAQQPDAARAGQS